MKKNYIIPIFIPHRGCRNQCVFCNQNKITGKQNQIKGDQVECIIKEYLSTIPLQEGQVIEVAYYGGSFTGIALEDQKDLLAPAKAVWEKGIIQGIRLSTRPDYIDEEILVNLKSYGVSTIELGVQSLDQRVLQQAKRGHGEETVYRAVKLIKNKGFRLGIQLMVGLPGDSEKSFLSTIDKVVGIKPDFVRIYPTLVIKETILARMYLSGEYEPLGLSEAVELCKKAYQRLEQNRIPVIRLGLQTTEEIRETGEILAGPYHPAFRELVESSLIRDKMIEILDNSRELSSEITLVVHPSQISIAAGHKKENIFFLQTQYGFKKIKILGQKNLNKGEINIKFRKIK